MDPLTHHFLLAALALALVPLLGLACSPPDGPYVPPSIEAKIHFSDMVVYGEVTEQLPSETFPSTAYSVIMKVYCIFKSDDKDENVPAQITIDNAGQVPGLCHSTNLTVGQQYIVYLGKLQDKYEPRFSETAATAQTLQDFSFYCDVDIYYPTDYDESEQKCPPSYPDYEDCIPYKPANDVTTIMPNLPTKPSGAMAEAEPHKTTPRTEVKIISNGNTVDQGHSIHTNHAPVTDNKDDAEEGDNEEVEPWSSFADNGCAVPLVSILLGAVCLLVALAARA